MIEDLRDLFGKINRVRRYSIGDKVYFFDANIGEFDEGEVVSTRSWGEYTIRDSNHTNRIVDRQSLRPRDE